MSRTADSYNSDELVESKPSNHGLGGKVVCPFCGGVNDDPSGPCPRCTMENTPITRQATKARIGPWYVLQTRNPSAPGMRYTTLLTLVRKGQVTGRSVVRGPTTFQLWKFAARVKGVAREFGVCYSCGGEIEKAAKICRHCSRSQEPPANPDLLLETHEPKGTVYKEILIPAETRTTEAEKPATVDSSDGNKTINSAGSAEETSTADPVADTAKPNSFGQQSISDTEAESDERAAAEKQSAADRQTANDLSLPESRSRPRQKQPERILSAADLAAAFRLEYNPAEAPRLPKKLRRGAGRVITLLVVLGLLAAAAVAVMKPSLRDPAVAWAKQQWDLLLNAQPTGPAPGAVMDHPTVSQPPMQGLPAHSGSGTADSRDTRSTPVTPVVPSRVDSTDHSAANSGGGVNDSGHSNSTPANPPSAPEHPAADTSHGDSARADSGHPADAGHSADSGQSAAGSTPTPAPAPAPQPADAKAATPVTPPAVTLDDQIDLALKLYRNAIDSESRGDFKTAVTYYEQIEKLPRDAWPGDLEIRLKQARQNAGM